MSSTGTTGRPSRNSRRVADEAAKAHAAPTPVITRASKRNGKAADVTESADVARETLVEQDPVVPGNPELAASKVRLASSSLTSS